MKRLALILALAAAAYAAPHRRSVSPPLTPLPSSITSWTLQITTSGGLAPALRTGIAVRSTGTATSLDVQGQAKCSGALTSAELAQLGALVAAAHPESWAGSYVNPSNPNCCDQIRTALALTVNGDTTYKTYWFDDHLPLPADLSAIYDFAFKSNGLRGRLENGCRSATSWSLELIQEGGFGGNYQRVVVDQSGAITAKPNAGSAECHYMLQDTEILKLKDSIESADAKLWTASYVRPENPSGCCDQIHTRVHVTRSEVASDGALTPATYTTEWYSDHPPLPSDLVAIQAVVFGPNGIYQRYGPLCQ